MVFPAWVDFLSLFLLSPVLYLAGRAAQYVRLPLITGYVLTGIIVGPYSLGILSTEGLRALAVVRTTIDVAAVLQAHRVQSTDTPAFAPGGPWLPGHHRLLSGG